MGARKVTFDSATRGSDLMFGAEYLVRFELLCFLRTLWSFVGKGILGAYGCMKSDLGPNSLGA